MKPSEVCKAAGLKSLAELCETVRVAERTMTEWYKHRPEVFQGCVMYAVAQKKNRVRVRGMILQVWEVYEDDTNRCLIFARRQDAESQDIFSAVDRVTLSKVNLTTTEVQALLTYGYIWAD